MKIYIPEKHKYVLDRAHFEYTRATDNLAWRLERAVQENNLDMLDDDVWHRLIDKGIDTCLNMSVYVQIVMWDLLKCEVPIYSYRFSRDNRECDINIPQEYLDKITIPEKEEVYYKMIQFGDWIAKMYPEEANIIKENDDGTKLASPLVKTVTFQVTDKCNLKCSYCYQINKGERKMSFETAEQLVDALLGLNDKVLPYLDETGYSCPGIIIDFIGGEPLLQVELIDKIIDCFIQKAIEIDHPWATKFCASMSSNGTLYTDYKVQKFLMKHRHHLSYSVTVDGTKELHDKCRLFEDGSPSYDLAHFAARDWAARGNYMGSKITFAPENIQYAADCMKQMVLDEYADIFSNVVFEDVWKDEDAVTLYWQYKDFTDWYLKKYDPHYHHMSYLNQNLGHPKAEDSNSNWCGGTGNMLAMDPDGVLFPCIRYMESSLGTEVPPYSIGNIRDGIAKNEHTCKRVDCLKCITRRSQSDDECFYCVLAEGCAWCSGYNYQCHGTANKRNKNICEMHKSRTLSSCYFWNKWYIQSGEDKAFDLWVPKQWAVPIIGEEEYNMLVELTEKAGGYVNKEGWETVKVPKERNDTYKGHEDEITPIDVKKIREENKEN